MLAETKEDYIAFGGSDSNTTAFVDGKAVVLFAVLGLKKVGAKYQYDARQKDPGGITFITTYTMFDIFRSRMQPWSRYAFPYIIRYFAYQDNGTIRFTELGSPLKKYIKYYTERYKVDLDLPRMLKHLRAGSQDVRADVVQIKLEQQFDSALLGYYFGFLEGDGSGMGLHSYFRTALDPNGTETASEILAKLIAGRDDARLTAEMTEKFKAIGVRFGK